MLNGLASAAIAASASAAENYYYTTNDTCVMDMYCFRNSKALHFNPFTIVTIDTMFGEYRLWKKCSLNRTVCVINVHVRAGWHFPIAYVSEKDRQILLFRSHTLGNCDMFMCPPLNFSLSRSPLQWPSRSRENSTHTLASDFPRDVYLSIIFGIDESRTADFNGEFTDFHKIPINLAKLFSPKFAAL